MSQNQEIIQAHASLNQACLKRRCEFIAGRLCARDALLQRQIHGFKLLTNTDRSPKWPDDIVGSITHTNNFAAAALGSKQQIKGIGIDSEAPIEAKRLEDIKSRIFLDQEISCASSSSPALPSEVYYTLIFSAKESLFKCIYPQTLNFFGFHDAHVSAIDWQQGTFKYQLLKTLGPQHAKGKNGVGYFHIDKLIHTAILELR